MKEKKINWFHVFLGVTLNALVIISIVLIYYAYVMKPKVYLEDMARVSAASQTGQEQNIKK